MMRVLSWNTQSTKGCDNHFDFERIVAVINDFGHLDVICLQEVSRNIEAYNGDDQKQRFEAYFNEYHSVWAPGFSRLNEVGQWQEFGNLTLVKKGLLLDSRSHILPCPAVGSLAQIPRSMVEVVVGNQKQNITIYNCHLAYHSEQESAQQLHYLNQLKVQTLARFKQYVEMPNSIAAGAYQVVSSGQEVLLCGDLNIALNSKRYQQLLEIDGWHDCASAYLKQHPDLPRLPTCGIFDSQTWPQGEHTRDYFLSSPGLASHVIDFSVNTKTIASDHQPIFLALA